MPETFNPEFLVRQITEFLQETHKKHNKKKGVIAVSGGIDSAVSLTLLTRALGPENIHPLFLPFGPQSTVDSKKIAEFNKIPEANWRETNISKSVEKLIETCGVGGSKLRVGNIMARVRMIVLYDFARQMDGLVCGTENKSEKYLGYFTRFGDEASDIEPLQGFYKTQVRALAEFLEVPAVFLEKAPTAGLWQNQTDEQELGFSYADADVILEQLIEEQGGKLYVWLIESEKTETVKAELLKVLPEMSGKKIDAVLERVLSQQFKHEVPYVFYKK